MKKVRVLFVCLGNICRSPMAEGLFIDLVEKAGLTDHFEIDSAGTSGHHQGELADRRMRETAQQHGISLVTRARQFKKADFSAFDYIAAMDRSVLRAIQDQRRSEATGAANVFLMRDYDESADSLDVPDPYYGGKEGFEEVFQILARSNQQFLEHLRELHTFEIPSMRLL